ncbi:MAG: transporter substrate-binding protein, partial [Phycisphaerales bacterium]
MLPQALSNLRGRIVAMLAIAATVAVVAWLLLGDRTYRTPIKVGILHSLTGTMSASESPVVDGCLLAIEQINEAGGVLGRPVEAIVRDGASDPATF